MSGQLAIDTLATCARNDPSMPDSRGVSRRTWPAGPIIVGVVVVALVVWIFTSRGSDDADSGSPSSAVTLPGGQEANPPGSGGGGLDPTGNSSGEVGSGEGGSAVPEPTGVPGLDDDDPFCVAWAQYSGTLQLLAVANGFEAMSPDELRRLDLVSAPSLVDAGKALADAWPAELGDERDIVLTGRVGPLLRRAAALESELLAAGLSVDDRAALVDAWSAVLATRDPSDPAVDLAELPAPLESVVLAAMTAGQGDALSAVPPFTDDSTLNVTSIESPATDAYLSERCPDLAGSGVGDSL